MSAILVFNAGSTSLKFSLFCHHNKKLLLERKGIIELKTGKTIRDAIIETKQSLDLSDVKAVGHRVVHGGDFFTAPTVLTSLEVKQIQSLSPLAPLHNPINVEAIKAAMKLLPKIPHVAVFDTAFHSKMPGHSKMYALPLKWYNEGIKRYGFHGINHQYCMEATAWLLEKDIRKQKLITCHLGGGASLAAITSGHSIDTTMGYTPLEGLMMATRSGSIDPGILFHLLETKKMTLSALKRCLNDESGLKGIANTEDMREILKARSKGDVNATLAVDLYVHHLAKGIAAMAASLGGLDYLVFSGGIGENAAEIRELTCKNLAFLEIALDRKKNNLCQKDQKISKNTSKVQVFRIAANEEGMIADETLQFLF